MSNPWAPHIVGKDLDGGENELFAYRTRDYRGAWVRWATPAYRLHQRTRSEIADWHAAMETTLTDPGLVASAPGGKWIYYRLGVLPEHYGECYLAVVVRWNGAFGDIASAFAVDEVMPVPAERIVVARP